MKKKKLPKDEKIMLKVLKLLNEILTSNLPTRILSAQERELLSKDAINYIFDLKEKKYLDEEKFEKIMLLSTLLTDITGEKNNFLMIMDIINFIYFLDNTDIYIPDILDILYSDLNTNYVKEEIN